MGTSSRMFRPLSYFFCFLATIISEGNGKDFLIKTKDLENNDGDYEDPLPDKPTGKSCYVGGVRREDGWSGPCGDGCNVCGCKDGLIVSTFAFCPKCSDFKSKKECRQAHIDHPEIKECEWKYTKYGRGSCKNKSGDCNEPKGVVGNCKNRRTIWTFDKKSHQCLPYFGCKGKGNKFGSKEACERICVSNTGKQEGENCGSCLCPPTYHVGNCTKGLICLKIPLHSDGAGICTKKNKCYNACKKKEKVWGKFPEVCGEDGVQYDICTIQCAGVKEKCGGKCPCEGKQEGENCGSCLCPPTYHVGNCTKGLICLNHPLLDDAAGTCTKKNKCYSACKKMEKGLEKFPE